MASYKVVPLDLSVSRDRTELIPQGTKVTNVDILQLSAGATLSLHFGGGPAIPVDSAKESYLVDECEPENEGIFITNAAQAGASALLNVSFAGQAVRQER